MAKPPSVPDAAMAEAVEPVPPGLTLAFEYDPPATFRNELGQAINAFHSQTIPFASKRFGLRLQDETGTTKAGLSGVMAWGWLFIDAVWVHEDLRGHGAGRTLMHHAETYAAQQGCHSAWLDTFQAQGFYQSLGYTVFGQLDDYPGTQSRAFLRKRLSIPPTEG